MLKVVVDTNIFVSGLLTDNNPRSIIHALIVNKFQLILSEDVPGELTYTLSKPRLSALLPGSEVSFLIGLIKRRASIVHPRQTLTLCRDPKDDKFLDVALESEADFLVTGDKDLLSLKSFHKTRILSPSEFIKLIKSS